MTEKHVRIFWKTGYWGFKISIILGLTVLIMAAFFIWRVHQSPLDLDFAKGFIEDALYDSETEHSVRIGKVDLYWPDLSEALYLRLSHSAIVTKDGQSLFAADKISLSFSRIGLLQGRLRPKYVIVSKPSIQIQRGADGSFSFGLSTKENEKPKVNNESQREMLQRIVGYIARPGYRAANDSVLARLEGLEIEDAQLFITDDKIGMTWALPNFSTELVSTVRGMSARFSLPLPEVNGNDSGIFARLTYFWANKTTFIEADLTKIDMAMVAEKIPPLEPYKNQNMLLDLQLKVLLDEHFLPDVARLAAWSEKGIIAYPDMFDAPIPYSDMVFDLQYSAKSGQISLKNSGIKLHEDIGLSLDTTLDVAFDQPENLLSGPVSLKIDTMRHEQIDALWPKPLRGDNSEDWIVKRMSEGTFHDVWGGADILVFKGADGLDADATNVKAGYSFENMSVDYREPLDVITQAKGKGGFDLNTDILDVTIEEAKLGSMSVKGATLIFDEVVAVGKGGADMKVDLEAKLQDLFTYISKEPINMGDKLDMDISKVKGDGRFDIGLKFPTQAGVKLADFDIDIKGTLTDTLLPDVLQDLDVSGGPMEMTFADGLVKVAGKGMLEKREMDFSWEEFLESEGKPYKSKVSAKISADPNIRQMLGIDLSDFLEGPANIEVDYTSLPDHSATAAVKVDSTPSVFFIEPFNFAKEAGKKGSASFTAHFKNNEIQKITGLKGSSEGFSVSDATITFKKGKGGMELDSGEAKNFTIGETKGKLSFLFEKDGTAKILMDCPFMDAQPFFLPNDQSKEYNEPAMKISVTAKSMRTAPEEIITNNKIYMDIDDKGRFNQLEMDALVGASDLYLRYKPDESGKRVFRLQTDDAGAFLKAFQVYNSIRGGRLVIYGEPDGDIFNRSIKGNAELTNFKVVNAPVLAKLLGIMSLSGFAELLGGDGLHFERLEAGFNWVYRKGGSLLVLKDGTTSGNSIGLTFDGTFDNAKRMVDVAGTIIPMSGVNGFIGKIPLVGDILTGGSSGGVFAATYSVKGPSENPVISFNPLSVLTPGILRRILFERSPG